MAIRSAATGDFLIRTTGGFYDPTAATIAFWLQLLIDKDASGAAFGIRNSGAGDGYVYFYDVLNDGVTYAWEHFDGGAPQRLIQAALNLGTWYFIAISRAGTGANQTTAYKRQAGDQAFTSETGTFALGATINEETVLTNGFNVAGGWFPGRMAALKQWSAPLTADELLVESYQTAPARLADLHSWRPMIAPGVAEAALDFSGNGRHLTPNGALAIEEGPPTAWRQGARRIFIPVTAAGGAIITAEAVITARSRFSGMASVARSAAAQLNARSRQTGQGSLIRGAAARISARSRTQAATIANRAAQAVISAKTRLSAAGVAARQAAATLVARTRMLAGIFEQSAPLSIDERTIDGATWIDDRTFDNATWEDVKTIALPDIAMTVSDKLDPIAIGDARTVRRRFLKLPPGATIVQAWLTIKRRKSDADAAAIITKEITQSLTEKGQITVFNTDGGELDMFFEITEADTLQAAIKPAVNYVAGIKVQRATGQPHTFTDATVEFFPGARRGSD